MDRKAILMILAACAASAAPAAAQGWIEPFPGRPSPGVIKLRTDVRVRVEGRVAHVEVEELFRNDGRALGEGDYLYPLPGEAVFSNLSLFQGDQELTGETLDAERARAIYEEIVRRRKDPALVELVGAGMLRARVFPIAPGETRRIVLRFTQVLDRAGDALQYRFMSGKQSPGPTMVVSDVPPERSRFSIPAPIGFQLIIDDGDRFADPYSPTHAVDVDRTDGAIRVRPRDAITGRFSLMLPFARDEVGVGLVTYRPNALEPGYFMLTVSPGRIRAEALPRDITVVLDVSGSMSGAKMDQARAALRQLLDSFRARDRFQLVAFSNGVRSFAEGWSEPSPDTRQRARRWVDDLRADGGTNIEDALAFAFRLESREGRLPITLFITDGLPSVGEQDPERLAAQVASRRGDARVFPVGIGYDVNTLLLDRLAAEGRGAVEYVEPGADVETALGRIAARILHPVLTDLAIDDAPVRLEEIFPVTLPDLFAGEELIVFGRYGDSATGDLTVRGLRRGRTERFASRVEFPTHAAVNDFIPRLWASRKLGHLVRQLRLEGRTEALVNEIRETALRFGLLSEYTSYLVLEPDMVAGPGVGNRRDRPMAAPAMDAASGAGAVRASREASAQRAVRSLEELAPAEPEARPGQTPTVRQVAGRTFRLVNGVWQDLAHGADRRVVEIAPFSQAYFDLLRAAPELQWWFAEFDAVLLAGADASIRITTQGASELSATALAELVRSYRGW